MYIVERQLEQKCLSGARTMQERRLAYLAMHSMRPTNVPATTSAKYSNVPLPPLTSFLLDFQVGVKYSRSAAVESRNELVESPFSYENIKVTRWNAFGVSCRYFKWYTTAACFSMVTAADKDTIGRFPRAKKVLCDRSYPSLL